MKITIYSEDGLELDTICIVDNLNRLIPEIDWHIGKSRFAIINPPIINPDTYDALSEDIKSETMSSNEVLLFTEQPYENNYFWDSYQKLVIISFFGWDQLTSLSINNGAVYFVCAILMRSFFGRNLHEENTGCINDFWLDKTGVDVGMRAAYFCPQCQKRLETTKGSPVNLLQPVRRVLHDLSTASRNNEDVCQYWKKKPQGVSFDVFICYNKGDKQRVREINQTLKRRGIKTWMDDQDLPPGRSWQNQLEEQIDTIEAAAIFVGPSGIGPWQDREIQAFLIEFSRRKCPMIPVILDSCTQAPEPPVFLRQYTWVDFRENDPDPMERLIWGITGKKPTD